jgi:hypothetical protein
MAGAHAPTTCGAMQEQVSTLERRAATAAAELAAEQDRVEALAEQLTRVQSQAATGARSRPPSADDSRRPPSPTGTRPPTDPSPCSTAAVSFSPAARPAARDASEGTQATAGEGLLDADRAGHFAVHADVGAGGIAAAALRADPPRAGTPVDAPLRLAPSLPHNVHDPLASAPSLHGYEAALRRSGRGGGGGGGGGGGDDGDGDGDAMMADISREIAEKVSASMRLKLGLLAWFCQNMRRRCMLEVVARCARRWHGLPCAAAAPPHCLHARLHALL